MSQDKPHIFVARFIVPLLTGVRRKLLHSQTLHVVKAGESSPQKMTVRFVMLHTIMAHSSVLCPWQSKNRVGEFFFFAGLT